MLRWFMFKTLYLGTLQGARIYIHWSFWILAFLIFLSGLGGGVSQAVSMLGFVFAVFACVFLHELGHAVAAKAFGRKTRDITLLPIGGVARIEGGEMGPVAEGWVAIAGPAVNFAIAASLMVGASISSVGSSIEPSEMVKLTPVQQLIVANLILAIFNLIPAFPLDGGRILRSLLCYWMNRSQATQVASQVGKIAAALLIASSVIWWNFIGIVFGLILYLINAAQGFQARLLQHPGAFGPGSTGPGFPGPSGPFGGSPFDPVDAQSDAKTIDAVEFREVPRR